MDKFVRVLTSDGHSLGLSLYSTRESTNRTFIGYHPLESTHSREKMIQVLLMFTSWGFQVPGPVYMHWHRHTPMMGMYLPLDPRLWKLNNHSGVYQHFLGGSAQMNSLDEQTLFWGDFTNFTTQNLKSPRHHVPPINYHRLQGFSMLLQCNWLNITMQPCTIFKFDLSKYQCVGFQWGRF